MIIKKQRIVFAYILVEFFLLNLSYLPFYIQRYPNIADWYLGSHFISSPTFTVLLINLSWFLILAFKGGSVDEIYLSENHLKRMKAMGANVLGFMGIFSFFMLVFNVPVWNRTLLILPVFLFGLLNLASFFWIARRFKTIPEEAAFGSNLLILGDGQSGKEVVEFSNNNKHLGYGVLGYVVDEEGQLTYSQDMNILGKYEDLGKILDREPVHELIIALPREKEAHIKHAIEEANYRGIRISMIHENPDWMGRNFKDYMLGDLKIMQLRQTPLDDFLRFTLKKGFDIMFSLFAIIFLSPVYLAIACLIVFDSGFPILYTPIRKREAGLTFKCFKFRSMKVSNDPNLGSKSTVKNDPRITRIGKFLRKSNLDELPQFFNVLRGEMSVVGPRPHRVQLKQDFRSVVQEYMVRHYVKPGITGWAQVNGWRGPTETPEQKEERIKHDLWYIENWSFFLDLKIIYLTVFGKDTRKNAF